MRLIDKSPSSFLVLFLFPNKRCLSENSYFCLSRQLPFVCSQVRDQTVRLYRFLLSNVSVTEIAFMFLAILYICGKLAMSVQAARQQPPSRSSIIINIAKMSHS